MLKAFTPVTVLIFSFFAGLEKTSCIELYIVLIICVGVAMASVGEIYFSWIGIDLSTSINILSFTYIPMHSIRLYLSILCHLS
jgi:hypothetical protein